MDFILIGFVVYGFACGICGVSSSGVLLGYVDCGA